MMSNNDSSIAFARNNRTNPLGKYTAEVPKFKVPEETKEILEEEANKAGMGLCEFVRLLVMVRAHGLDEILSLEKDRLAVVAGTGSK